MTIKDVIKLYEPEENIKEQGGTIVVNTSNTTAPQLALVAGSLFNDYEYVIKDSYTLEIRPSQKLSIKLESIAKNIDSKFEDAVIELYDEKLEVTGESLDEIASYIDSKYPEMLIEITENKIIVKKGE